VIDPDERGDPVESVVEVSHLSVRFGTSRILEDLSFRVPRGTSLAIIGPNGSGKTVLFIALGLRYLGVLLMGALLIIPAATAKRLARNLSGMLWVAVAVAVVATAGGGWLAAWLHRETGPLIVMVAAGAFALALLRRPS
jgi:uncharacterized membrane protein YfcA